jgi:chromosome segregation ATPase
VLDAVEVERVAGYGPVPALPWETPVYAYRVWERRRVLRGLLVHARATAAERARAVDDALVATLDSLRPVLLASPESAPLLEPSAAAQARREERLRAITQLEDEASRELSEIDQEQEQAKLEIQHHRNEKDALALEAARLYEAARQGGGSEPLDEVRAQMAKHEASATGAISELAALRGRRRAREEGLQSTLAAHHADLDKIEAERRALLLEAGRAFVAGQRSLDEAGLGPVQAAGEQHRLALRQIATLEAALGGYDRARIREGVLFVVGSLATLALLLALGVLRMVAE